MACVCVFCISYCFGYHRRKMLKLVCVFACLEKRRKTNGCWKVSHFQLILFGLGCMKFSVFLLYNVL